jgi:hypothetical protein
MFAALKKVFALSLAVTTLGIALAAVSVSRDAYSVFAGRMWERGIGPANEMDLVTSAYAARDLNQLQDRFYKPAVVLLASR